MNITVFSKKRQTRDGKKTFYNYIGTLKKKDGTEDTVAVKFREECGAPDPKTCPCNIIVDKGDANLSARDFVREDTGEVINVKTLWVNAWSNGAPYVDHSLDDYE